MTFSKMAFSPFAGTQKRTKISSDTGTQKFELFYFGHGLLGSSVGQELRDFAADRSSSCFANRERVYFVFL